MTTTGFAGGCVFFVLLGTAAGVLAIKLGKMLHIVVANGLCNFCRGALAFFQKLLRLMDTQLFNAAGILSQKGNMFLKPFFLS